MKLIRPRTNLKKRMALLAETAETLEARTLIPKRRIAVLVKRGLHIREEWKRIAAALGCEVQDLIEED